MDLDNRLHRMESHLKAIFERLDKIPTVPPCYTKKEAAQRLNISVRKLDAMIQNRDIVGFYIGKIWRMKPENLERWMDKRQDVW